MDGREKRKLVAKFEVGQIRLTQVSPHATRQALYRGPVGIVATESTDIVKSQMLVMLKHYLLTYSRTYSSGMFSININIAFLKCTSPTTPAESSYLPF